MISNEDDWAEEPPFVCPGCYAVGGEKCAGYCPDAAIARDREAAEAERYDEDPGDREVCECGMCWHCDPSWRDEDTSP